MTARRKAIGAFADAKHSLARTNRKNTVHLHLRFGTQADGSPRLEPVHAEPLGGLRYRLANSPGWTYGVAAGDEVERTDEHGGFRVVRRSGNVAVRLFSTEAFRRDRIEALESEVRERLGGWVDGGLDDRARVFTIPATTGFERIEALFDPFVRDATIAVGAVEWEYGNVHDESGAPLGGSNTP
ncbi:MAG: DUF4265 domain-containing protein [Panacagrimonas sp.]